MTAQQSQHGPGDAEGHDIQVQPMPGGYVLRGTEGSPLPVQLTQGIVLAVGAAFAAAALVLLLSWDAQATGHGFARVGAASLLGAMAVLMLWFATRGGVAELHLDLAGGELREVVRHRLGPPTVVGRHALGGTPALAVSRNGPPSAPCALILRTGDKGGLCIAQGSEAAVLELRRRLDSELGGPRDAGLGPLAA